VLYYFYISFITNTATLITKITNKKWLPAISEHWDEIKKYIDGTETIEACYEESGNCYYVDADISNGIIERIYFSNGGFLDFFAKIDEDGSAWDFDENGNSWDFTIDINSSIVEDAVYEWAEDNNYEIE
jgi:hypothetical protein